MAFFYDNCDYFYLGVYGTGTTEVSCTVWEEEMLTTSNATRDAFLKALNEYILSATNCVSGETCETIYDEKIYTDFYQGCYIDYLTQYSIFWNMMKCEENKTTGVVTQSVIVPTINGGTLTVNYEVDYGDGSFDIVKAEEYQTMCAQFMCCIKNIMVLIMNENFEQSNMPEFYPIT